MIFNIALNGMESILGIRHNPEGYAKGEYAIVKYADDFVVFCPSKEDAERAKDILSRGLLRKGLNLSEEKTHIRHITEGFDFLGFTIRHYETPNSSRSGYKLLIKPSMKSVNTIREKIKEIWYKHRATPTAALINELNPVIRGWSNYFCIGVAKKIFGGLDKFIYHKATRYMKRRHPSKAGWLRTQKYWGKIDGHSKDNWVFMDKKNSLSLRKFSWTRIKRHILVPKNYSSDDPELKDYWNKRKSKTLEAEYQHRKLRKSQNGRCPVCHQYIENGEEIQIHHRIPKKHGGSDKAENLILVHLYCHQQIHSINAPREVSKLLEPCAG